jgi:hypothetical protein
MPVVINELEVTPAEPPAAGQEAAPATQPDGGRHKDVRRQVDRHLEQRAARAARLRAV